MHAADTLGQIAIERHREQTRARVAREAAPAPTTRLRAAAFLRRTADRLDAGRPEPASFVPLGGRGL